MPKTVDPGHITPRRKRGRLGKSLLRFLLSPIHWLTATLVWIAEGIALPFFWLVGMIRWWLGALVTWWHSQNAIYLIRGLPFLLAVCLAGYAAIAASIRTQNYEQYSRAAASAISAGDNATAKLYLEGMARQNPANAEILFRLASVLAGLGDSSRSQAILRKIAPEDTAVYVPAHLLRANQILSKRTIDGGQLQSAVRHLFHVISLDPKNAQARGLLGEIYMQQLAWEDAELHLQIAGNASPQYSLQLAKTLAAQGKSAAAKRYGQRAQTYFREIVLKNRSDRAARLGWGESTMFLEEFESARDILQGGLLISDEPQYHQALTKLYVTWSDVVGDQTPEKRARQFQLLAEALKHNPREFLLFDRIMAILKRRDDITKEARDLLVNNIAAGQAVGISHLLLGTFYGDAGDNSNALQHLQIAYQLDPSMYIVANNLAWYLAHATPPKLEESLLIASQLAEALPENAAIRDTRGQILAKLGRWRESLIDLEAALPMMRHNLQLHQTLGTVYEHLGMPELAAEHRRIIQTQLETKP